jgi:hypothetical protein
MMLFRSRQFRKVLNFRDSDDLSVSSNLPISPLLQIFSQRTVCDNCIFTSDGLLKASMLVRGEGTILSGMASRLPFIISTIFAPYRRPSPEQHLLQFFE